MADSRYDRIPTFTLLSGENQTAMHRQLVARSRQMPIGVLITALFGEFCVAGHPGAWVVCGGRSPLQNPAALGRGFTDS